MTKRSLCILGSTGSIGTQSLDIIHQTDFRVGALAAASNIDLLEQQVRRFHPDFAAVEDEQKAAELKLRLADTPTKVLCGRAGILELSAMGWDMVLNAVVGIAGLLPTMNALQAGSDIALANKETLVTGGHLVMSTAKRLGRTILPVDSEHSAVFQSLQGSCPQDVRSIVLTASGGPFLGKTRKELACVTKADALAHPNWSMGQKISIDSATMMNKGLEVIEALHLFGVTPEQIQVVVHPQSIVHSLVEFNDGAMIAQLSTPDMRLPIQYALTYPRRLDCPLRPLSLAQVGQLTFLEPDRETFGLLAAAERAIGLGGLYPAALNGANEQAVSLFLQEKISFLQIQELVCTVFDHPFATDYQSVEQVLEADRIARNLVLQNLK